MNALIWFGVLVALGWLAISILPTILPLIGYAIVGVVVLYVFGAVVGKK